MCSRYYLHSFPSHKNRFWCLHLLSFLMHISEADLGSRSSPKSGWRKRFVGFLFKYTSWTKKAHVFTLFTPHKNRFWCLHLLSFLVYISEANLGSRSGLKSGRGNRFAGLLFKFILHKVTQYLVKTKRSPFLQQQPCLMYRHY